MRNIGGGGWMGIMGGWEGGRDGWKSGWTVWAPRKDKLPEQSPWAKNIATRLNTQRVKLAPKLCSFGESGR